MSGHFYRLIVEGRRTGTHRPAVIEVPQYRCLALAQELLQRSAPEIICQICTDTAPSQKSSKAKSTQTLRFECAKGGSVSNIRGVPNYRIPFPFCSPVVRTSKG